MNRIPSLDGLRAISIVLVIAAHWLETHYGASWFSPYANLGVRVFFVISGYLITSLLLKEHAQTLTISLRGFYRRRAYRILPAAAVFMFVAVIIWRQELRRYDIGAAALYLVNFDFLRPWFIGHLWSLSVEEQFYLLWPGVFKRWHRHRVAILAAVIVLAPVYSSICYLFKFPGGGYGTFPSVADNLAFGCLLAILAPRIPKISGRAALVMLSVIAFVPLFAANTRLRTIFMLFILWPLMHACIAGVIFYVVHAPYRFLNCKPVVWLGQISYSLYLWQQPFSFSPRPKPWYMLLVMLSLATASYYFVEQPMLRLRDRRWRETMARFVPVTQAGD